MLAHSKMVNCDFCGSSVVLEDDTLRRAGEAGTMLEAPELVAIGQPVMLATYGTFTATGHVRYDYGRGHWDEYHGALSNGDLVWVSVDEGDIVLQHHVSDAPRQGRAAFRLGAEVTANGITYACSEVDNAVAVAFRGQLPEEIILGETHLFANFTGPRGAILSGEIWDGGVAWYAGHWIDPFDVERLMG